MDLGRKQAIPSAVPVVSCVMTCAERLSVLPSLLYPPWESKRKRKPSGAVA